MSSPATARHPPINLTLLYFKTGLLQIMFLTIWAATRGTPEIRVPYPSYYGLTRRRCLQHELQHEMPLGPLR